MMTGEELRRIRKKLRLNQGDWGKLMGVTRSTVSDWEIDRAKVPKLVERVALFLDDAPQDIYRLMPELKGEAKGEPHAND